MIIETIAGKAENGIINEYPTDNFKRTGKGTFVSNLEEDLKVHMKDMKGEGNLNVAKNCYGLIPQSNPRLNINRGWRVKRMTCPLKSGGRVRQVAHVS